MVDCAHNALAFPEYHAQVAVFGDAHFVRRTNAPKERLQVMFASTCSADTPAVVPSFKDEGEGQCLDLMLGRIWCL